jgi:signal transduction histidine kinase
VRATDFESVAYANSATPAGFRSVLILPAGGPGRYTGAMDVLTIIFAAAWVLTLVLLIRSLFRQAGIEDAVKETADQAQAQMRLWEEFGQHLDEGVAILDENAKIVYANDRFATLTGAIGQSSFGQEIDRIITLQDAAAETAALPTGTVPKQLNLIAKDGRRTPVKAIRRSLHKPKGFGVVILLDTSAEQAEREIRQRLVKLSSFELRAPVTAMKGYASMLLDGDAGKLPKEAADPLQQIMDSCEKVLLIIDDMANVEALSSKRAQVKTQDVDVSTFLEAHAERLGRVAETAGRKFHVGGGKVPARVSIDPEQIARLLSMLVNTAARTSQDGSEVVLAARDTGGTVNIEITNQGSPLPKDSQANVFDYVGGSGLDEGIGFHVAKQIIEAHHAYVTVNTKANGNVFVLSLPRVADATPPPQPDTEQDAAEAAAAAAESQDSPTPPK